MSHIFDEVQRELGVVIDHGRQDTDAIQQLWHDITGIPPATAYDSNDAGAADDGHAMPVDRYGFGDNPDMSVLDSFDTLRTELADVVSRGDQADAALQRFLAHPEVADVVDVLERVPAARDVLVPVLAMLKSQAPAAEAKPADAPADPSAPVDPQIQTGIAQ